MHVNEEELFDQSREQRIAFAKANSFKRIFVSKNEQMRTNRTGGLFERRMDAWISKLKNSGSCPKPKDSPLLLHMHKKNSTLCGKTRFNGEFRIENGE